VAAGVIHAGLALEAWLDPDLPGADPRLAREFVLYTAHYDHLGLSTPDERGDSVYNGFSDNAAGCAMPLAIAGAINLDAGTNPAPDSAWRVAGGDRSTLEAMAVAVARSAGWAAEPAPASPNTDYFPPLRIGVPAVFLVPGPGPFEGLTAEASRQLRQRWDHYHQAADEWAVDFPFAGLVRYADFGYRLGMAIAAGPRPRILTPP
jgi:hypothetical protein